MEMGTKKRIAMDRKMGEKTKISLGRITKYK